MIMWCVCVCVNKIHHTATAFASNFSISQVRVFCLRAQISSYMWLVVKMDSEWSRINLFLIHFCLVPLSKKE
jgi:hypothetical protein